MSKARVARRKGGFLRHHGLSMAAIGILLLWIVLYVYSDPKTHLGSFFGNAIADWTGVVVTVIATKYFYEIGSAESKQPSLGIRGRLFTVIREHSLTIFLGITGAAWLVLYLKMNSEAKWGQVVGNIVSEWTQLLGLVLMTKRLIEDKSKESR
jgi:ABC-type Co2+ transport system permease subunit